MSDMFSTDPDAMECCTLWVAEFCGSEQPGSDFKGIIFTFPSGKNELKLSG